MSLFPKTLPKKMDTKTCPPCSCPASRAEGTERDVGKDDGLISECASLKMTTIAFIIIIAYTIAFVSYLMILLFKRLRSRRREQRFKQRLWSHQMRRTGTQHRGEAPPAAKPLKTPTIRSHRRSPERTAAHAAPPERLPSTHSPLVRSSSHSGQVPARHHSAPTGHAGGHHGSAKRIAVHPADTTSQ